MKTNIVLGVLCLLTDTQAFDGYNIFDSLEDIDTGSDETFDVAISDSVRYTNDRFYVDDRNKLLGSKESDENIDSLEYGFENDESVGFEENKEMKEESIGTKQFATDKTDKEKGNSYYSYVLWRPSVLDDSGIMKTEKNYHNLMVTIKNLFNGEEEEEEKEEKIEKQGRNDDIKQLDLPRISALISRDEPTVYDNFVDTVHNLKVTVNDVASRPEVKDNMFYIIMGLTGFLLLAFLNENLFKKPKPRNVQNHYLLPNTGAAPKLPTYDECMKAEKNLLVNIGNNEVFSKVNLPQPVFAVVEDKVEEDGIQNN